MTTGEITSKVEKASAPLKTSWRRHPTLVNNINAPTQNTNSSSGFTRNQHARPSKPPAAIASPIRCRLAANNKHHTAPSTSQLAGASAFGVVPDNASNGDNAAVTPANSPVFQPNAVAPIPTISSTDSESITSCTRWSDTGDRSPVTA